MWNFTHKLLTNSQYNTKKLEKGFAMKRLLQIVMILVLGTSLTYADAFEKIAASKATKVMISSQEPLALGLNTLTFDIKNKKYKDAKVNIKLFMPAMPGMPYMEDTTEAKKVGNGKYEAKLNFTMRGTWQMFIYITPAEGKKVRVKSSLNI